MQKYVRLINAVDLQNYIIEDTQRMILSTTDSTQKARTYSVCQYIRNAIRKSPTVNPVEYSQWVWNPDAYDWGIGAWVCKRCGHINGDLPHENPPSVPVMAFAASHYCNNCGSKMTGVDSNEL